MNFLHLKGVRGRQIFAACLGITLSSLGIALFYYSALGADPVSVFVDGLHLVCHISYGTALNLFNFTVLAVIVLFMRSSIHIGLILYMLFSGVLVDVFTAVITSLLGASQSGLPQLLCMLSGVLSLAVGTGIFISSRLGSGPWDMILLALHEHFHIPYRYMRIGSDAFFATLGVLFGGIVGVGTICSLALAGFIVDLSSSISSRTLMA